MRNPRSSAGTANNDMSQRHFFQASRAEKWPNIGSPYRQTLNTLGDVNMSAVKALCNFSNNKQNYVIWKLESRHFTLWGGVVSLNPWR